jgi:hypothetical protein
MPRARMPVARRDLKEAGGEPWTRLANRTRTEQPSTNTISIGSPLGRPRLPCRSTRLHRMESHHLLPPLQLRRPSAQSLTMNPVTISEARVSHPPEAQLDIAGVSLLVPPWDQVRFVDADHRKADLAAVLGDAPPGT